MSRLEQIKINNMRLANLAKDKAAPIEDGAPAIVWLIYLASSPKVQGFVPMPPNPLLGMSLTLAALGIGTIFTIVRPERGPHDWLFGTWVVPR